VGVTALRSTVARLFGAMAVEVDGVPEADFVLAPHTAEDAARILDFASEHGLAVLPWGGGTHQGLGGRFDPAVVIVSTGLDRVVDWQPDDLTVVVEAGVRLADLEASLAERGQSVVASETPGEGTIGGMAAAGVSGWRRLRYGPVRERMLEVLLATGDGRVVRAGGRVVKNVTGYDIPRLVTGSLGSLGMVVAVCLKLWPVDPVSATVRIGDPGDAEILHRPLAVLEEDGQCAVYLGGPEAQVDAETALLGGLVEPGLQWPAPFTDPVIVSVRVPPALVPRAVEYLPDPARYVAAHGVGEVVAGFESFDVDTLQQLRSWAESRSGALVLMAAPDEAYELFDPWGTPPPSLAVQRRVKAAFDPMRVMVPGRLPGGL
jgi:glycolate oxidase FAD binding subunit